MKLQMSIRLKFMLLVGLSFSIALVAILISTRNVYIEDKETYLYDDLLTSTSNDAKFLSEFAVNKRIISKLTFSNVVYKKVKDSEGTIIFPREFFLDNPSLIDFRLFRYGNKEVLLEDEVLNKTMQDYVDDSEKLFESGTKMQDFLFLVKERSIYSDVFKDDSGLVQVRIGFYNKQVRLLGLFRFNLSFYMSKLSFGQTYSKILIDSEGRQLYSNFNSVDRLKKIDFQSELKAVETLNSQVMNSGVKPVELKEGKYFAGFSRLPELGVTQISLLSEKLAYKTIDVLVIRTLRIALFTYVGIFILFALFSETITKSIKDLIEASKDAVEGNYRQTIVLNTGDEVGQLVTVFNEMVRKVQAITSKLSEANKNLEQKVEERTADLKTSNDFIIGMINSLDEGLFVFTVTGKILPIYTKACEHFFGQGFHAKNVKQVLPFNDDEEAQKMIKNMFKEMIPFESLASLAPKSIGMSEEHVEDPEFFHGGLKYFPMRNEEGAIQFVIVVASDETKEFQANYRTEQQKAYVERVVKMIRGKNHFLTFLKETESNLSAAKQNIMEKEDDFDVALLMRIFHSIKGMAGQFSANELSRFVHQLEGEVSGHINSDKGTKKGYLPTLLEKIKTIEELMERVKEDGKEIIGGSIVDGVPREEIPRTTLKEFRSMLELGLTDTKPELIESYDRLFLKVPIKSYFESYNEFLKDLTAKLGKKIHPIKFENGDILVDKVFYQPIFNNFVHIFRNIADHGIESPEQRMEKGKDPLGNITIQFKQVRRKIEINILDDGSGIDPERIREKMREKGYDEEIIAAPDEDVITHIFDANFSTKEQVTSVSGRGAGMDAVKDIVEKNGGAARVQSALGKGTTFKFRLPLQ